MRFYILDKEYPHIPIKIESIEEYGKWEAENPHLRILRQHRLPGLMISTVFLCGVDHNYYDDGPPILFETMIFGEPWWGLFRSDLDQYQERYRTWLEATAAHSELLTKIWMLYYFLPFVGLACIILAILSIIL